MSAVENQDPPSEVEQQEPRKVDAWNKDVNETGRWGSRSVREILVVGGVILVIIGATIAGLLIAGNNDDDEELLVPVKEKSNYTFPEEPEPIIVADQQTQLNILRDAVGSLSVTSSYLEILPETIRGLQGKYNDETADPVLRAASWLVTVDPFNEQQDLVRRFALAVVYYNNGGSNWKDSSNWLSDKSHCKWKGISCCRDYQTLSPLCTTGELDGSAITQVDLYNNNLTGEIPTAFSLISELQSLFLSENKLTGGLNGAMFQSMPRLIKLYLQHNQLSGSVPANIHDNGVLDTLFVQGNELSGEWPSTLCPRCPSCPGFQLAWFGLDCDRIQCATSCCRLWDHCFYHRAEDAV